MFGLKKKTSSPCTKEDTLFFYLLCAGREIRHDGELERGLRSKPFGLGKQLLSQVAFINDFLDPLKLGVHPVWKPYSKHQQTVLAGGFRRHLGLDKVTRLSTWQDAIEAAMASPRFLLMLEETNYFIDVLWLQKALETSPPGKARKLAGRIEATHSGSCRGYVVDTSSPGDAVLLDIYINDSFAGQTKQTLLRRDLQEQYGGHGKYGFECNFTIPEHLMSQNRLVLRAVDHDTGFPAFETKEFMPSKAHQRTVVEHLVHQLEELSEKPYGMASKEAKSLLTRINKNLPSIERASSIALGDYSLHHISLPEADTEQTHRLPDDTGLIILGRDKRDHVANAAIPCFSKAAKANPNAHLFYADFEIIDAANGTVSPYFRAAFDPELLLSDPRYTRFYAVRTDSIDRNEKSSDLSTWLQILSKYGEKAFCHVPRILARLSSTAPVFDTSAAQTYLMTKEGKKAAVKPHIDQFAPPLEGFFRVARNPQDPVSKLAVIIPTRDNLALIKPCIESLRVTAQSPDALDIMVVDNGSEDPKLLSWLADQEKDGLITLLRHNAPFNWSELNNLAASKTNADILLFLNDDTKSVTPGWDTFVRCQLEREEIGVLGARLFYEDGTLQHAGVIINSMDEVRSDAVMHDASGETADEGGYLNRTRLCHRVSAVTGAFLACTKEDFTALKGFDAENFAVAFNDIDFCLRMRANGKQILYDPAISFFHYESKSRGYDRLSEEKRQRVRKEHEAMIIRWHASFKCDPYYPPPFLRRGKPFSAINW